jgi:hypothetical protein
MHVLPDDDNAMPIHQQDTGIKIVVFWDEVPCNLVSRILRNIDKYLVNYTASDLKRRNLDTHSRGNVTSHKTREEVLQLF